MESELNKPKETEHNAGVGSSAEHGKALDVEDSTASALNQKNSISSGNSTVGGPFDFFSSNVSLSSLAFSSFNSLPSLPSIPSILETKPKSEPPLPALPVSNNNNNATAPAASLNDNGVRSPTTPPPLSPVPSQQHQMPQSSQPRARTLPPLQPLPALSTQGQMPSQQQPSQQQPQPQQPSQTQGSSSSTALVPTQNRRPLNQAVSVPNGQNFVDITEYLNMPQSEAAKKLNIPPSTLSKRWKEAVRNRKWPWRVVCKLDKEIMTLLHNVPQGAPIPEEIEGRLGYLMRKRQEELKPVVIRL